MDEQEAEETQQESKEQVMTAQFAFMGRTFQCRGTLTQLRELKSFVNAKKSTRSRSIWIPSASRIRR